jgi:RNA polymerase sigma-70 factor (ECF subfamily)
MTGPGDSTTWLQGCLDRLRAGDDSAREQLLTRACDRLGRLARKMLRADPRVGRWEDTDDVRQNAMLRLYRALAEVRPATPRDFFRLAALHIRRELIDLARRHYGPAGAGRHHESLPAAPSDRTAAPVNPEPADASHDPQRLAHWSEFHAAVERLPDEEREAFDLLWYHDLSQAEAAALLGVSERTLQRRWRSARRLLAGVLPVERPDGGEPE